MLERINGGVIGPISLIRSIGAAKWRAVMMIDFAPDAVGRAPREAAGWACGVHLWPILMTATASTAPPLDGPGPGSELRHPPGVTIVGGLAVRQVPIPYTTPVINL